MLDCDAERPVAGCIPAAKNRNGDSLRRGTHREAHFAARRCEIFTTYGCAVHRCEVNVYGLCARQRERDYYVSVVGANVALQRGCICDRYLRHRRKRRVEAHRAEQGRWRAFAVLLEVYGQRLYRAIRRDSYVRDEEAPRRDI